MQMSPVLRNQIREPKQDFNQTGFSQVGRAQFPDLAWRAPIGLTENVIEAPDAPEAGRHCNRSDREPRFVEKLLGKVQPACLRNRDRGRPEVLNEQPMQMTWPDA